MLELTLAACLALAPQDEPRTPDGTTSSRRTLDVNALRVAVTAQPEWFCLWTPLTEPHVTGEERMDGPTFPSWYERSDDAVDFLRSELTRLAAPLLGDSDHLECWLYDSDLTASGTEAGHVALERVLAATERWLTRRWSVELIELPRASVALLRAPILSASDVDTLLTSAPPSATRSRIATPRRNARFAELRRQSFVYDGDVTYIDKGGLSLDPMIGVAEWGRDTLVQVLSRSGGGALVVVGTWGGEPIGEPRFVQPHVGQECTIELLEGAVFQGFGSGVVPDGGALALAPCGPDGVVLLVRVTRIDDHAPPAGALFVGLGAATFGGWMATAHRMPAPVPSGGEWTPSDSLYGFEEGSPAPEQSDDPSELLQRIRDVWVERGERGAIASLGSEALVVGEPHALASARELVRVTGKRTEVTYGIELRFGEVSSGLARGLIAGAAVPVAMVEPLLVALGPEQRWLGASTSGTGVQWMAARELAYIQDFDIEVGMGGITLPDPIYATVTDGASAACRVLPMRDERLLVSLELRRRALERPVRTAPAMLSPRAPTVSTPSVIGILELPEAEKRDLAVNLPVRRDTWTVAEVATRGARAEVVLVRVSEAALPW